ncbi:MAG: acetyl-CoA carboxylase carboxyltransferase subunit alpha [Actinobacteria bacterium]|nr:acetyl-CoA carboxylase carboxyltransferase subunit alpha [Cyanobacteriota bacterium]MCL5771992.1 acetyl-CoA carboxylase carboxyltransferase subunit alpha [Actinomycetota bacterium]
MNDELRNENESMQGLYDNLSKISLFKKIKFLSKLNFAKAKANIIFKIKNLKKDTRIAERAWRIVELSRNEKRPKTTDYIKNIFDDFIELSGDRLSSDDKAITTGLGKINGRTVAIIGHNKGKDIKERIEYNFGMPNPSGYRKSQRIMELADKFNFPVITFIDTPGANPAIEAEDSGQASAIAKSIELMFKLKVPTIVVLIGEGGSGGALALAIGNYIMMLENSTYSVISPEGCAAILWKDQSATKQAAAMLKLTAKDMLNLNVIDKIIHEPKGGAQNDPERMIKILKDNLIIVLSKFDGLNGEDLKIQRSNKFESLGFFEK